MSFQYFQSIKRSAKVFSSLWQDEPGSLPNYMEGFMDIDAVQTLYSASCTARKFIDHMASRKRNQRETSVDRILELLANDSDDIDRKGVIDLFRDLERLGCGQFVTGRRGYRSRFVWAVDSLGLSQIATGESLGESIPVDDDLDESETFHHAYILRGSFAVSLELPSDLTKAEAERLAMFIRSLPLED